MRTGHILAYGLLGLPLAFAALPIYVHVPHYYAETAGMQLALLGAILLGTRLLDAGIDPWLGWLADRVARPRMVAIALVPFAIGFVALLNPPTQNAAFWLIGSLTLTYVGFSAASVAYQAWGADIGLNSGLRTRLTAAREGFGLLGVVLAAALPTLLAANLSEGIERLSWILPPLLLVAAIATFVGVGFKRSAALPSAVLPDHSGTAALLPSLRRVLADIAFRRLLGVFVANGIASALPATLFLFFVADILQLEKASGPLLALYFVAGAASLPLWVKLSSRFGRVYAWLGAIVLSIFAFAGASLLGSGDLFPSPPSASLPAWPRRRSGATRRHRCRSRRTPGPGWRLFRRLEFCRQAQSGARCRAGPAAPRSARLRAGGGRRAGFTHFCLCLVAPWLQGAGRPAALALAAFSGDLT
jgi:GPH family glycoside/pentoside/hexuronide:cation symporter